MCNKKQVYDFAPEAINFPYCVVVKKHISGNTWKSGNWNIGIGASDHSQLSPIG